MTDTTALKNLLKFPHFTGGTIYWIAAEHFAEHWWKMIKRPTDWKQPPHNLTVSGTLLRSQPYIVRLSLSLANGGEWVSESLWCPPHFGTVYFVVVRWFVVQLSVFRVFIFCGLPFILFVFTCLSVTVVSGIKSIKGSYYSSLRSFCFSMNSIVMVKRKQIYLAKRHGAARYVSK